MKNSHLWIHKLIQIKAALETCISNFLFNNHLLKFVINVTLMNYVPKIIVILNQSRRKKLAFIVWSNYFYVNIYIWENQDRGNYKTSKRKIVLH